MTGVGRARRAPEERDAAAWRRLGGGRRGGCGGVNVQVDEEQVEEDPLFIYFGIWFLEQVMRSMDVRAVALLGPTRCRGPWRWRGA